MKIRQGGLETDKVSTGKKTKELSSYDKDRFSLEREEPEKAYLDYGREWALKYKFKIISTVKEAIELRMSGERVLTRREADVLARKGIDFNEDNVIQYALCNSDFGGYIVEDETGGDDIWYLRHRYNKGLEWKENTRHLRDEEAQMKGDQLIADLISDMMDKQLPPWSEELEKGFPIELTKPEYMTWDQYTKARKVGRQKKIEPSKKGI